MAQGETSFLIYALGSNGSGQLSLGHFDDVSVPQLCKFHPSCAPFLTHFQTRSVKKLIAGGNHTLVLFDDGLVCVSGRGQGGGSSSTIDEGGNNGQQPSLFRVITHPQDTEPLRCKDIAATWDTSVLISEDGNRVYVLGRGLKGELGLGEGQPEVSLPQDLLISPGLDAVFEDVSTGMSHVVVRLSNGEVWGWGTCRKGELGFSIADKGKKVQWMPKLIEGIKFPVEKVICAKNVTVLFGEEGRSTFLGEEKWIKKADISSLNLDLPAKQSVSASWGSLYILRDQGSVVACGRNDRGQLPPPNIPNLQRLAAGSEHVIALTTEGRVVSWGWGEHGNCGLDSEGHSTSDTVAGRWNTISVDVQEGWRIVDVGAGCATSFIIMTNDDG